MEIELNYQAPPHSNQDLKLHSTDFSTVKQAATQALHNASLGQTANMIKIPLSTAGKDEALNENGYDPNSPVLDQFAGFHDFDLDSNMQLGLPEWQRTEQVDSLEVILSRKGKRKQQLQRRIENMKRSEAAAQSQLLQARKSTGPLNQNNGGAWPEDRAALQDQRPDFQSQGSPEAKSSRIQNDARPASRQDQAEGANQQPINDINSSQKVLRKDSVVNQQAFDTPRADRDDKNFDNKGNKISNNLVSKKVNQPGTLSPTLNNSIDRDRRSPFQRTFYSNQEIQLDMQDSKKEIEGTVVRYRTRTQRNFTEESFTYRYENNDYDDYCVPSNRKSKGRIDSANIYKTQTNVRSPHSKSLANNYVMTMHDQSMHSPFGDHSQTLITQQRNSSERSRDREVMVNRVSTGEPPCKIELADQMSIGMVTPQGKDKLVNMPDNQFFEQERNHKIQNTMAFKEDERLKSIVDVRKLACTHDMGDNALKLITEQRITPVKTNNSILEISEDFKRKNKLSYSRNLIHQLRKKRLEFGQQIEQDINPKQ